MQFGLRLTFSFWIPLRYVNYNVYSHTIIIFMIGSVIVIVCGVRYD